MLFPMVLDIITVYEYVRFFLLHGVRVQSGTQSPAGIVMVFSLKVGD